MYPFNKPSQFVNNLHCRIVKERRQIRFGMFDQTQHLPCKALCWRVDSRPQGDLINSLIRLG